MTPSFLLDTDNFSANLYEANRKTAEAPVGKRIASLPFVAVVVSVVTYAEVMRGILNLIQRTSKANKDTADYEALLRADQGLHLYPMAPYTNAAHEIFTSFSPAVRRVGRAGCQIAAIALASGLTVVTRNTRHFSQIPGVVFEDWTRSE